MDAYQAARIIEDIGATTSRTEKERLVGVLAGSEVGKFILTWTYNPFITFGIKPARTEPLGRLNLQFKPPQIEVLLSRLASRDLTGHAAEREVGEVMQSLDSDGANLLFLILSKDLKCGIAANTINLAIPGLIPVFSVQRAQKFEAKRLKEGKAYKGELKLDGQRNTMLVKDGHGGFFTRSGQRVPALDFLVKPILTAAEFVASNSPRLAGILKREDEDKLNFMLDGEAMMGLFEETGALRRKDAEAVGAELHLYDILPLDDFDATGSTGAPFSERRSYLEEFVWLAQKALRGTADANTIQIVPSYFVNNEQEVQALFEMARNMSVAEYLARGDTERRAELEKSMIDKATGKPKVLEGIVIKDLKAPYEKKKSYAWMKLKSEETLDLQIVGVYNGELHTKYENLLGGVIVDHNGVHVRIGGGWSDDERAQLWALWEKDARKLGIDPKVGFKPGFVLSPDQLADIELGSFELLTRLIEVEFMEVTPDGSLRHPRYTRFRDDKQGELAVA